MVDDKKQNFPLHPENGITVSTWRGSRKDQELRYLCEYLINMHESKMKDVRKFIKKDPMSNSNIFEGKKEEN